MSADLNADKSSKRVTQLSYTQSQITNVYLPHFNLLLSSPPPLTTFNLVDY